MHCAVIGAGLAGLATAFHLEKKKCKVTLFDEKGVGGGASGIASGLIDPYPGRQGVLAKFGLEGRLATLEMVDAAERTLGKNVSLRNGILRKEWPFTENHADVERLSETEALVHSGVTLYMKEYLEGVFASLENTKLIRQKIAFNDPLLEFDRVIYAIGFGFNEVNLSLPIHFIKGQILTYMGVKSEERSTIGKIYLAPLKGGRVQIGSTYEHHFIDIEPNMEKALSLIRPKLPTFFPEYVYEKPIDCHAAIRVARKESYLPLVEKIDGRRFIFTGLGSRGLLYHSYYGRHLADLVTSTP